MTAARVCLPVLFVVSVFTAGCATPFRDAENLANRGQHEQAYQLLDAAAMRDPEDIGLRSARLRQKDLTLNHLANQADMARLGGQLAAARVLVQRGLAIDPQHSRLRALSEEIERAARHDKLVESARKALAAGGLAEADTSVQRVLAESPGHPGARALQLRLRERAAPEPQPMALGAAFQKPVTLEFRDAPLRSIFEGLGRSNGVNFVFDKDVRSDARVSIMLKDVSIDDALRVILSTQQLERKLLNDSTVLIYPNSVAKQREHQDLVTRSFYLTNADVKQAQALVRTIAKTRDMFIEERLNLLVIRDTPEVVRLVERLIASIDLPEPEVVLEVEVMEISSNRLDELGIQWPELVQYGLTGFSGQVELGVRDSFRASIANPALAATLRGSTGWGNVLANPRLRARNREKAKVVIGDKVPVFTTTSTANVGVSASVSYLDVGLKLEVEPSVQLDSDVVMKVNLEVSTLKGRVAGPQGAVAYQIGTRQATTSLRLRDGETQILAGLIRSEDTKSVSGLPGLSELPLVGRLFGVHTDGRDKTEVVLLITPRVVRNIALPDWSVAQVPSGVDASPGAEPLRLRSSAKVGMSLGGGAGAGAVSLPAGAQAPAAGTAPAAPIDKSAVLVLSTTGDVEVGSSASVTLQNRSTATVKGEIEFDPTLLQSAQGGERNVGRLAFALAPGGEQVFLLRVLPTAAGQTVEVGVVGVAAAQTDGQTLPVRVEGSGVLIVGAQ